MRPRIAALLILVVFLLSCATSQLRRDSYIQSHPELSERNKERIRGGYIGLGMSKAEVEASWGRPDDINKTVGVWGVHEQWIYGYYSSSFFMPMNYVYFKNGYLDSWQQ